MTQYFLCSVFAFLCVDAVHCTEMIMQNYLQYIKEVNKWAI